MPVPIPPNESARLRALQRYQILDSGVEESFEDLVRLAAMIAGTPSSSITFIDDERQWLKAKVGLTIDATSRDVAFCAHTILGDQVLMVPDTALDPRFADNPFVVADGGIRFYAGAPLLTADGHALGAVCALDRWPRSLSASQLHGLELLSRTVVRQLELRKTSYQLAEALASIRVLEGLVPMCASCHRIREDERYWKQVDAWLSARADVMVSHTLCPDCVGKLYPEFADEVTPPPPPRSTRPPDR